MNKSLRLFQKVNIWGEKNSSKSRLFSIGILAVNLPLLGSTLYLILHPQFPLGKEIFAVVFFSTIAGFILLNHKISQVEQSIIKATTALNSYCETGEILNCNSSPYYELKNLFKAIEYNLQKSEQRIVELETIIGSRQEEFFQILLEQETAESHLRQCLGIASRHHLPLCIALVKIEGIDLLENSDPLKTQPPEVTALIQKFQQLLRESDWAVHWGDQEFLLAIFSELPGTQLALSRILNHFLTDTETLPSTPPQCSMYIGFTAAQPNEHYRACIERTNQALQKAKTTGEHCVYL
ncbi:diguanylate cyclase domain-containing protein [Planktothrix pseudagardhii]|uniref:GGDEF domain-containing protein n=1 Tax=Planktothrix pseudagardhii TaxID=132604 RepID=A0A9W4CKQ4_9CYAN|nr:diguanylate cyclase [Planktothrix pseudagardhii]CAD5949774.1 hypothetical protein NO713_02481 [Planktothrix pseudagardhii]